MVQIKPTRFYRLNTAQCVKASTGDRAIWKETMAMILRPVALVVQAALGVIGEMGDSASQAMFGRVTAAAR